MNAPVFTIAKGVAIPARTLPTAGPRESKYPVDDLQPGDAFAVVCRDEKEARQKQSQFSSLARTRKISLVTRIITKHEDNPGFTDAEGNGLAVPFIAVWHDGAAKPKRVKKTAATEATTEPAASDAGASEDAGGVPAAPEAPAAPATTEAPVLVL